MNRVSNAPARERWIRGQPAAPTQRPTVAEGVLVDVVEPAILDERDSRPELQIETFHPGKLERLPRPQIERAFAAVPVAVEYDCLLLGDVKDTVGVEPRADVERVPRQFALRQQRGETEDGREQARNGQPRHADP